MIEYLTLEDALILIEDLAVGPVRDLGLLDSALHRPTATLWGRDAYATTDEKAAALLDSLVRNHPLVDGNKRLGWLATLVFLDINGHWIEAPDDDAYQLVMAVAAGELSLKETAEALSQWRSHDSEEIR
ncbi:type II toxin-antitoxin system death-on-curing family toxin [Actinomyces naeslundii]|uniref:type II toxin-antitoxin system death-on-curing family toxin n=1 Tax=Actinomyces naeslundii TaxID=1655 RepID=UPI00096CAC99|nr:type II toxin-antitoxin system death-on-curing family toxin [Actinomyces naeslundii]OMG22334.1 alcohol dehydrogenase [Actinomyces naeslundii]OMG29987.1 alcohol dehydrogenase [Actinomyces naeslundii]